MPFGSQLIIVIPLRLYNFDLITNIRLKLLVINKI